MSQITPDEMGADIVVEVSEESISFDGNDVFLSLTGLPPYCVGMAFLDNKITLVHALHGTPVLLYVESPMESGSAFEYDPEAAIAALLDEAGIRVESSGCLSVGDMDTSKVRPLSDFDAEVLTYSDDCVLSIEELIEAAESAYEESTWD